jgi:hypothetical protein
MLLISLHVKSNILLSFLKNPLYHFAWLLLLHLSLSHPLGDAHPLMTWSLAVQPSPEITSTVANISLLISITRTTSNHTSTPG